MDLFRKIDGYCERVDFSYWSEPVNAVTNLAFIIAALIMWRRSAGLALPRALAAVLMAIGIGSYLFHTHATVWGGMADTLPILGFILLYIYAANRVFWGLGRGWAVAGAVAFIPYAAALTPVLMRVPGMAVSSFYWPVPILIAGYGIALRGRAPATGRGLLIGAGVLCVSLVARSADMAVCGRWPLGTHFLWHLLNGAMLGWMIEVLRRHMLAGAGQRR